MISFISEVEKMPKISTGIIGSVEIEQVVESFGQINVSGAQVNPFGSTEKSKFVFYDNGGQDVFQTPNSLFLTDGCIVMIMFDMQDVSQLTFLLSRQQVYS